MEDYKKGFALFLGMVVIVVSVLFLLEKDNNKTKAIPKQTEELNTEQIYFKNIQLLDDLPIDQSLLIQDEITYFFIAEKKDIEEVELIDGSLENLGDYKYKFKVKYKDGTLDVFADKNKVDIK